MKGKISQCKYRYGSLETKLNYLSPVNRIKEKRMRILDMENRLEQGIMNRLSICKNRLTLNTEILKRLSPLNKLESGFSYVQSQDGKCLKKVEHFQNNENVFIHVTNGLVTAKVLDTKHFDRE